jgi:hypothetical protein
MSEEQLNMLQGTLDPIFWKDKFLKQKNDVIDLGPKEFVCIILFFLMTIMLGGGV